jgi:hypothetical protein
MCEYENRNMTVSRESKHENASMSDNLMTLVILDSDIYKIMS